MQRRSCVRRSGNGGTPRFDPDIGRVYIFAATLRLSESHVLQAEGLRYDYPGGAAELQGLDLRVERGRRLALSGANGCGKTTLLLHLNGTLRPRAGALRLDGRPAAYDRRALADGRVGLVLHEPDDQLLRRRH